MTPRFSLVYPTRHRPQFLAQALAFLEQQTFADFEVVVSDNWVDPALSCEEICHASSLANLKYVRPPEPVGMVANWNFAAEFATGDYVCIFTDKMFLLPDALARADHALRAHAQNGNEPEILSWVSDAFQPARYPDYFGRGEYTATQADRSTSDVALAYDPQQALAEKCEALVSRYEQTPTQYCQGKMVFGAYSKSLIARITRQFVHLFHDISPDYTSMILALSVATSAIELRSSAVVSINTDLSNGMLGAIHDQHALGYLRSLAPDVGPMLNDLLVPGMYASQANVVSHDYLSLQRRFQLGFQLNTCNWLGYCIEDLSRSDRVWSSADVEQQQMMLLNAFVGGLAPTDQHAVIQRLETRIDARNRGIFVPPIAGQRQTWAAASLDAAIQRRCAWS